MITAAAFAATAESPTKANPSLGSKDHALVVIFTQGTFLGMSPLHLMMGCHELLLLHCNPESPVKT